MLPCFPVLSFCGKFSLKNISKYNFDQSYLYFQDIDVFISSNINKYVHLLFTYDYLINFIAILILFCYIDDIFYF